VAALEGAPVRVLVAGQARVRVLVRVLVAGRPVAREVARWARSVR
jgi:hypothetical protein